MSRTSTSQDADLRRFADELRVLRLRAGKPGYRQLAERTRFGRTVLSQALNGSRLPTWEVTRALVVTLGGDEREWQERWARVAADTPRPQAPPPPADHTPTSPDVAMGPGGHAPTPPDGHTAGPDRQEGRESAVLPTTAHSAGAPGGHAAGAAGGHAAGAAGGHAAGGPGGQAGGGQGARWGRAGVWAGVAASAALVVAIVAVTLAVRPDPAGPPAAPDTRPAARSGPTETCFEVVAQDVRVFTEPRSQSSWSSWRTGTLFWGAREAAVSDRLRVPLRNGSPGWVTANPKFVRPSTSCG